jgi:hypothetical protein
MLHSWYMCMQLSTQIQTLQHIKLNKYRNMCIIHFKQLLYLHHQSATSYMKACN